MFEMSHWRVAMFYVTSIPLCKEGNKDSIYIYIYIYTVCVCDDKHEKEATQNDVK
jgi:hypothetical protein